MNKSKPAGRRLRWRICICPISPGGGHGPPGRVSKALWIQRKNRPGILGVSLEAQARPFVDPERGVATAQEALQGASDILAEAVTEKADLRAYVRRALYERGIFAASIAAKHAVGTTNYEMYRTYRAPKKFPPTTCSRSFAERRRRW